MRVVHIYKLFTSLLPTQKCSLLSFLPIQWVAGAFSLGVKWPEHEADHSPPSSGMVKNVCSYTPTPSKRLHGAVHKDNFTDYFLSSFTEIIRILLVI
jgi:putative component of membrane protein insertase Oxa1/YidC/SpoIIIJ protein YidD